MRKYLTAKEVKKLYNLHISTLHRWSREGIIHPIKTAGGHRRYDESELLAVMGKTVEIKGNRCAIYARVSTKKQADNGNLIRQLERLQGIAKRRKYAVVAEYQEVASGLNENRKELSKLLKIIAGGQVDIVLIEYRDRLTRFGYKYLKEFCRQFNVVIEEVDDRPNKEPQEELVEDMIAIVTGFSARLYGKRGGRVAKKLVQVIESEVAAGENDGNGSNP
ncbi:Resolvase domain protein [Desulfotomaculum nigrificans CO-1-SRB]|uniref:Resolvase domain protein n=1 Tax=Desulfotomaculum nigrificans (strain DSM 14880 / VKM B-2319 / CO-1-SRB) TaxID=868595 RepID=F6B7K2_DESCC|nr:IS607 family transposase [Desulfotomaculum nigrificans]AEF94556.1 Resolvase domain protein [Desulfotomaculum nigrificans CO-1-SRB]